MLEEFVDSVLIIDDNEEEIKDLKQVLEGKDIWVTYFNPPKEKQDIEKISKPFKNRKLLFLDLRIDETKKTIDNISVIIRPLLKNIISNNFGNYGIVMWTKHDSHISEFKDKIQKDTDDYQLPLFVVQMNKTKYLRDGFDKVLNDLNDILHQSIAANFFINWSNLIRKGRDNTISSIFELIPDYQKQDKNLEFLLFKMAINNIGIPEKNWSDFPLYKEAYKSFTDMLSYEISKNIKDEKLFSNQKEIKYLFDESNSKDIYGKYKIDKVDYDLSELEKYSDILKNKIKIFKENSIDVDEIDKIKKEKDNLIKRIRKYEMDIDQLFAQINARYLLDEKNIIDNDVVFPGRIYEIKNKEILLVSTMLNEKDIPIAIEMTPPCDFANNKNDKPKLLGGFITKYSSGRIKQLKSDSFYTEIYPLKLSKYPELKLLVFDFKKIMIVDENDLGNNNKFQLLFQAKDKLFADILQKMSAYTARLGLPIIR